MPVPKRKRSRSRRDKRFANKGMFVHTITSCNNCATPLNPHTACSECGFYKGAKVLKTKIERAAQRVVKKQTKRSADVQKTEVSESLSDNA